MTLVIAHRGASWDLPENSLPAFERAVEVGADYVEFDVRLGPRRSLVCGHGPADECVGLADVLETLRGRIGLAVDFKQVAAVGPTLAALEEQGIADADLMVVSFRRPALEAVRALRPGVRLVLHLGRRRTLDEALGFWGVGLRAGAARPGLVERARAAGLAPTVYTVNEEERMRTLVGLGVEAIFSDRPDLLRTVVEQARA